MRTRILGFIVVVFLSSLLCDKQKISQESYIEDIDFIYKTLLTEQGVLLYKCNELIKENNNIELHITHFRAAGITISIIKLLSNTKNFPNVSKILPLQEDILQLLKKMDITNRIGNV